MWSAETERLRERYHALYGLSMGLSASPLRVGLLSWWSAPKQVSIGLLAASLVSMFVWRRWGWRPYQRAYQADLDAWVGRGDEALRALGQAE
jgi:hypothetical protein